MARFSGGAGSGGEGTPGPQGVAGPTGPTGPAGADGAGFNYQGDFDYGVTYGTNDAVTFDGGLWKLNNFIGAAGYTPTPGQWSLILPPGATGPSGADGATGPAGADGSAGLVYLGNYVSGNGYIANVAVVKGSDDNLYIATSSGGLGDPVSNVGSEWDIFLPKGTDGADGTGFRWTGEWSMSGYNGYSYVTNDVVELEGSVYICVASSMTSQRPIIEFGPGAGQINSDWELMASSGAEGIGFRFRDGWTYPPMDMPEPYVENDIVTYNGVAYIAKYNMEAAGVGTPGESMAGWKIFAKADGFTYEGGWDSGTFYQKNDIVLHENTLYIATSGTPMGTPGGMGGDNWEVFLPKGTTYRPRGTWSSMGPGDMLGDYTLNDLVIHNGNVYLATSSSPSGTPGDFMSGSGWTLFVPKATGFDFRGEWDSASPFYYENDIVTYNGTAWIGIPSMSGMGISGTPGNSNDWQVFTSPGTFRSSYQGAWQAETTYSVDDIVIHNGSSWLSYNNDNVGNEPYNDNSNGMMSHWIAIARAGNHGSVWYNGGETYDPTVEAPSGSLAGDYFYKTDTGDIYYNDSAVGWNVVGNILGPTGPTGADAPLGAGANGEVVRYSPTFEATGLTFTGTDTTYPTYNSHYVKNGRMVSFFIEIDLATVTDFGTGQYKTALPFAPLAGTMNHFPAWVNVDPILNPDIAGHAILQADHLANTSVLDLHYLKQAGGANSPLMEAMFAQDAPAELTTTSKIYINGTYITAE
jgi:hypothetical protein